MASHPENCSLRVTLAAPGVVLPDFAAKRRPLPPVSGHLPVKSHTKVEFLVQDGAMVAKAFAKRSVSRRHGAAVDVAMAARARNVHRGAWLHVELQAMSGVGRRAFFLTPATHGFVLQ